MIFKIRFFAQNREAKTVLPVNTGRTVKIQYPIFWSSEVTEGLLMISV